MPKKVRATFSLDPDALSFLEDYAEEREESKSASMSELLLHLAGEDKANPKLVESTLHRARTKRALDGRLVDGVLR